MVFGFLKSVKHREINAATLNTMIKAAAVDHKYHDTNMRAASEQAKLEAQSQAQPTPTPEQPTPGPTGAFPEAGTPPPGPAVNRPAPGGLPSDLPAEPPVAPAAPPPQGDLSGAGQ